MDKRDKLSPHKARFCDKVTEASEKTRLDVLKILHKNILVKLGIQVAYNPALVEIVTFVFSFKVEFRGDHPHVGLNDSAYALFQEAGIRVVL